jgi:hypothetical protein
MSIYTRTLTIPKNTPVNTPIQAIVNLTVPHVVKASVRFPGGVASLVGVRVFTRGRQFAPLNLDDWLIGVGESLEWEESVFLDSPYTVEIRGYNLDDTYPHSVYLRLWAE